MKKFSKLHLLAVAAYIFTTVVAVLLFVYFGLFENVSIERTRPEHTYSYIQPNNSEVLEDETAPAGVRKVYRWRIPQTSHNENCLSFYVAHQSVEVYFDDDLMYTLRPRETNLIGKSTCSNWVQVPIYPSDSGRRVTVVITPLFEGVADNPVEFVIGSHYAVFRDSLISDWPSMLLASICILLGVLVSILQLFLWRKRKSQYWSVFFLGNFAIILGTWRITDLRSSTFLFSGNPLALGYIAIGCLCICCIPLLLFMKERFANIQSAPLLHFSIIMSCGALIIFACQVFSVAEFREMLPLCHVMMIVSAVVVLVSSLIRLRREQIRASWHYSILLVSGMIIDLSTYYGRTVHKDMYFTMTAFAIYTVILFTQSMIDTNTKVYTDQQTGLFNKNRWDELMDSPVISVGDVGVMMLDLNRLKYTNDTMGHEAGDRMIFNFSNILRNTLPASCVICRWGGDEFAVMITDASYEKMEKYVSGIRNAVEIYNDCGNQPPIHFAVGYALSQEFPNLSRRELLSEADERMYRDKEIWYADKLHIVY